MLKYAKYHYLLLCCHSKSFQMYQLEQLHFYVHHSRFHFLHFRLFFYINGYHNLHSIDILHSVLQLDNIYSFYACALSKFFVNKQCFVLHKNLVKFAWQSPVIKIIAKITSIVYFCHFRTIGATCRFRRNVCLSF